MKVSYLSGNKCFIGISIIRHHINIFYVIQKLQRFVINLFFTSGFCLYPQEASEKQWFPDVFRGYRKRPMASNGLRG